MEGLSRKIYLILDEPTEEDNRSAQIRILDALCECGYEAAFNLAALRKLHPICMNAEWKITVSLAFDGKEWIITDLEEGDQTAKHYGIAVDLGSTTVAARLVDCNTGDTICETSVYNRQIQYGTDILTRIFDSKDVPEQLENLRSAAVDSINEAIDELTEKSGVAAASCIQMVVSGNTTMIHFLLGMDAFCIFAMPYAVRADQPGFLPAKDLGFAVSGYVYICPGKANYLGGDIISGMIDTQLYRSDDVCAFFDIGTNGELVIGNKDFLLCGAGAAGPALEGGVVKTGMRAAEGAVDEVHIVGDEIQVHVMGETEATGICGSGIVDLISELFLHGWIDLQGLFVPEDHPRIVRIEDKLAVSYAPGLYFYQNDIDEFIRTKAAAYTMVELMLRESGFGMGDISRFYAAGAFGKHLNKESAIAIGMYPDMDRTGIINAGNSSLEGAHKLLLNMRYLDDIAEILEKMIYIQFATVPDFLDVMRAAMALPHTDRERYPSVMKRLYLSEKTKVSAGNE